MRRKKGMFQLFSDMFVFIIFIGMVLLFLVMANVSSQRVENSLTSNFNDREADAVLISLMRTAVNVDINYDGEVDAETVADLISISDNNRILAEEIREIMVTVCGTGDDTICSWQMEIPELNLKIRPEDNAWSEEVTADQSSSRFKVEDGVPDVFRNNIKQGDAVMYIPRTDMSIVKVVFYYNLGWKE